MLLGTWLILCKQLKKLNTKADFTRQIHLLILSSRLLAFYHFKYFVSQSLILFTPLHFTVQRDTAGLSAENAELKIRLQAMEQQAQLRDGEHAFIFFFFRTVGFFRRYKHILSWQCQHSLEDYCILFRLTEYEYPLQH
jgi:hypothetical protein